MLLFKILTKLGQSKACESIIVGMLEESVPNIVSYTNAIGDVLEKNAQLSRWNGYHEWDQGIQIQNSHIQYCVSNIYWRKTREHS